ncbi:unnamed protein product [Arctia plantaginis]|uniref:Uncharacterized protein n=1 Tax=Arctia plantaginis TaxID=874455 RepID=A0A8S1BGU1_ARCPL|nr:unnamed protein product [Arctia plantaginis]
MECHLLNVESREDAKIPVLEAKDLNSLIEKFKAIEKVKTKKRSEPVDNVKENIPNHDHCSPEKRHGDLKKGKSSSIPEVLTSNNKTLDSKHRSCKNKRVVYQDSSNKTTREKMSTRKTKKVKKCDDVDFKKKTSTKPSAQSARCEKLSSIPTDRVKNKILGIIFKKRKYNPV